MGCALGDDILPVTQRTNLCNDAFPSLQTCCLSPVTGFLYKSLLKITLLSRIFKLLCFWLATAEPYKGERFLTCSLVCIQSSEISAED